MKKLSKSLLVLALFSGSAEAHRDRILHVDEDGTILDIPAEFGKARLIAKGLGSQTPMIEVQIGPHQTILPLCVTQTIHAKSMADVQVTGSWFHDEETSLPYYVNVQFFDPAYDPKRSDNSGHEFLFNLHNAKLIDATTFKATEAGDSGQSMALKLSPGCYLGRENQ